MPTEGSEQASYYFQMQSTLNQILAQQNQVQADLNQTLREQQASRQQEIAVLQTVADNSTQAAYSTLFSDIPRYDGKDPDGLFDWLDAIEMIARNTNRDPRTEAIARAGTGPQQIIMSVARDSPWKDVKVQLIKEFTPLKSETHAILYLSNDMHQRHDEPLRTYIFRYQSIYMYAYPDKLPSNDSDKGHWVSFMRTLNNKKILEKVMGSGPDKFPHNLEEVFRRALRIESQLQLSEGAAQFRGPAIFEINHLDAGSDNNSFGRKPPNRIGDCWYCGRPGHFKIECPDWIRLMSGQPDATERTLADVDVNAGSVEYSMKGQLPVGENNLVKFIENTIKNYVKERKGAYVPRSSAKTNRAATTANATSSPNKLSFAKTVINSIMTKRFGAKGKSIDTTATTGIGVRTKAQNNAKTPPLRQTKAKPPVTTAETNKTSTSSTLVSDMQDIQVSEIVEAVQAMSDTELLAMGQEDSQSEAGTALSDIAELGEEDVNSSQD